MGKSTAASSSRKRTTSSSTTTSGTQQAAVTTTDSNKKQRSSKGETTTSNSISKQASSASNNNTMFSKKKKNASTATASSAASASSEPHTVESMAMELFKVISEDPSDPNAPATMEGIALLGEKLGMDAAEDIRILVFLWKLGVGKSPSEAISTTPSSSMNPRRGYSSSSSNYYYGGGGGSSSSQQQSTVSTSKDSSNFTPGTIQASEWKNGCINLHIDSWDALIALKPSLDTGFLTTSEFRDFYKFCFRFNLSGTLRTLDSETVIALLYMILSANGDTTDSGYQRIKKERLDSFCNFLQDPERGKPYQRITLDQWMSFWDFCQEIPDNDELINGTVYDESTSAWPVLIDEYVEYIQKISKK